MNKQALINKLTKYVERYEGATDEYYQGKRSAYEIALKSAKKLGLDEPQKPVVPKFVADYIEEYRGGGATLYEMMDSSEDEVYTWLFGNPRIETENERQLLFAQAYAVGYEVEKEPLYRVKIGEGYFVEYQERGALIIPDGNKEIKIFDSKSDAERTAQTIGGAVVEVAEG